MGLRSFYYDRQGRPIILCHWVRLLEDADYRRVARTTFGGDQVLVSTVWVGVSIVGCRGIFETMVFRADEPGENRILHDTEEEALAGHQEVVEQLCSEGLTPDENVEGEWVE